MASPVPSGSEVAHEIYTASRLPPIRHVRELGRGGFSIVDAVEVTEGLYAGKFMARKVVRLPRLRSQHRSILRSVLEEVSILNRLQHVHVVTVAFTYEELDAKSRAVAFGVLMPTVADQSLAEYLEDQESDLQDCREDEEMEGFDALLQKIQSRMFEWFGCLSQALAYLHQERVRHRDIKPANILIKNNTVFLTDFGLSKYFEDQITTMTYGLSERTPMYCAPEVAANDHRGRPSDIWSLGCVFLEMTTISAGASLSEFASSRGPAGQRAYHLRPESTLQWALKLRKNLQPSVKTQVDWCLLMLNPVASKRITAASLAKLTVRPSISPYHCTCSALLMVEPVAESLGALERAITDHISYSSLNPSVTWDDIHGFKELKQQAADPTTQTFYEATPNHENSLKHSSGRILTPESSQISSQGRTSQPRAQELDIPARFDPILASKHYQWFNEQQIHASEEAASEENASEEDASEEDASEEDASEEDASEEGASEEDDFEENDFEENDCEENDFEDGDYEENDFEEDDCEENNFSDD